MTGQIIANVERWSAWTPLLREKQQWAEWAKGCDKLIDSQDAPALDFLPPMFRRRLSQLCRMALYVAFDCLGNDTAVPSVFASRHGEVRQLTKLLTTYEESREMSPAAFSASVHNTASGFFAIANKNTESTTAIAAGIYSFEYAFLEAAAMLDKSPCGKVLVVVADEIISEAYGKILPSIDPPLAAAFLLTREGGRRIGFSFDGVGAAGSEKGENHLTSFLRWFVNGDRAPLVLPGARTSTVWENVC